MYNDFTKYGRMLFDMGINNSHSGNMSMRDGDYIYITKHGAQSADLTFRDIVKINFRDAARDQNASLEAKVHRAIYAACPDVRAIVHAHPPYGIVVSLKKDRIKPVDHEGLYYLPEIPVVCCEETIASDAVAELLPPLMENHKAALVRGHGAFAAGKNLEEATLYMSVLESACRIVLLSEQMK